MSRVSRRSDLRVVYLTSVCDPGHTISATAFWWADVLGSRCRQVDVIALDTGGTPRPNVRLHSLHRSGRARGWHVVPRLAVLLARLMPAADVVFCQYSTKFVFAAWPFAALWRKPIVLWWSHGHVDWRLRLATRLVRTVVTSSPDSFRPSTDKKLVIGHGVDVEVFSPDPVDNRERTADSVAPVRIVSIGRISPVKDVHTIVAAAGLLRQRGVTGFTVDLVGETGRAGDAAYLAEIRRLVQELSLGDLVRFAGPVPHDHIVTRLRDADIFVNALTAGGVGRAWLEAMSAGLPVVLCTDAVDDLLQPDERRMLRFREGDAADLADRLQALIAMDDRARRVLGARLRQIVVNHHSLGRLADQLHKVLLAACGRSDCSGHHL